MSKPNVIQRLIDMRRAAQQREMERRTLLNRGWALASSSQELRRRGQQVPPAWDIELDEICNRLTGGIGGVR